MLVSQKAIRPGRHTLAHLKLFEPLSQLAKGRADFFAMQGASDPAMLELGFVLLSLDSRACQHIHRV